MTPNPHSRYRWMPRCKRSCRSRGGGAGDGEHADAVDQLIAGSKVSSAHSVATLLVVLPEYFLTSFPMGESINEWRTKACIAIVAQSMNVWEIGNRGVYCQATLTSSILTFPISTSKPALSVTRAGRSPLPPLTSMFAPTPHDVLSQYREIYGDDGLFLSPIHPGQTACVASEEILIRGGSRIGNPRRRGDPALIE